MDNKFLDQMHNLPQGMYITICDCASVSLFSKSSEYMHFDHLFQSIKKMILKSKLHYC